MTSEVIVGARRTGEDRGMPIYADDLTTGQRFAFGSHTLTEEAIVAYAREWDPIAIHADPAAARETPLGGVVASGLQTLAVYQRLVVEVLWSRVAGGLGRTFDVRFRRPVRPGTTLTGGATVSSVTPRAERGDAIVVLASELVDDDGAVVLQISVDAVLPLRPAAPDA